MLDTDGGNTRHFYLAQQTFRNLNPPACPFVRPEILRRGRTTNGIEQKRDSQRLRPFTVPFPGGRGGKINGSIPRLGEAFLRAFDGTLRLRHSLHSFHTIRFHELHGERQQNDVHFFFSCFPVRALGSATKAAVTTRPLALIALDECPLASSGRS